MIEKFKKTISALRHPKTGCPWDLKQDHMSLRPYLLEESYELIEAIQNNDDKEIKAELGDVLLQVVLHSQLASEREAFDFDDVVEFVNEKIIRRHPHVFSDGTAKTEEQVKANWEKIKLSEGKGDKKVLDGIPKSLPALAKAFRLGEKASHVGFDWDTASEVREKITEELCEVDSANNQAELEEEIGDLLFSVAQFARKHKISPEDCLNAANNKFTARFNSVEGSLKKPLSEASKEELEEAWEKAKVKGLL